MLFQAGSFQRWVTLVTMKNLDLVIQQVRLYHSVVYHFIPYSDPITKQWLASNTDHVFGFPSVVRFSWSTAANILASESLPVHWSADNNNISVAILYYREDDEDTGGSAKITQFFSSKRSTTQDSSHRYFRERNLKFVTCL